MDKVDLQILRALQHDGRLSNVELAQHVHLSESATLRRVRALEEAGYITRYVALLSAQKTGFPTNVFVNITLHRQDQADLQAFEEAVRKVPEVMECYLMTGDADYLLRVVVSDIPAYERFVMDHLTRLPGVASIRSSFALKQVKYRTALPLGGE